MPYTPAHAILVAPIWYGSQKSLPLAPLIVGSLAPDLPYLIHLSPVTAPGHSPLGLLTHAVPHGLALLILWYLCLEKPILTLFSLPLPQHQWSWSAGLKILGSLWLGAVTHALIDAASHEPGWFVQNLAILRSILLNLPIYKWIQYGGGLLGLFLIAIWYWNCRVQASKRRLSSSLIAIATISLTGSSLGFISLANWIHQSQDVRSLFVNSATGVMTGLVLGAALYSLYFYLHHFIREAR